MKRTMLLIAILFTAVFSYAQKGLFDLEFDAIANEALLLIESKGFVETSREGTYIKYESSESANLPILNLNLTVDKAALDSWSFVYDIAPESPEITNLLQELVDLHGEPDIVDDFDCDYIWYYPNDRAIYVYPATTGQYIVSYTYGNFDEDEFYYYEYW